MKFRIQHSWRVLALVFAIVLAVLSTAYLIGTSTNIPVSDFTRDPAILEDLPFYTGLLSNLGIILWSSAAMCCLMSAILLRGEPRKVLFMVVSGLSSLYLGLDDIMMIHDSVFPDYLHVDEKYVYFTYLILGAVYALFFYKDILLDTDFPLLAVGAVFFAISIYMDHYVPFSDQGTFIEDGSKLIGIAFWLAYFMRTSVQWVRARMNAGAQNQVQ